MAAYYAEHPELKEQPGSGWKPYNRIKYFVEQRLGDAEAIPLGARWKAFLRKNEIVSARAKAATASWFSLGPTNYAGRILELKPDPNSLTTIYAGAASGGIWRSTNAGVAWTPLDDELPVLSVNAIAIFPSNTDVILIGTGEGTINSDRVGGVGVLKSTDRGATWGTTSLNYSVDSGHGFHAMEVNPLTEVVLAASRDGVWRSSDQGDNWTRVGDDANFTDIKWKPGSADTAYTVRCGSSSALNGIYRSVDGGLTFSAIGTGLPAPSQMGRTRLGVTPANPNYIYAGFAHEVTSGLLGIYRSTDAGETWSLRANTPNIYEGQGWYNNTLMVNPGDPERIYAGGVNLYRSVNGGATFSAIGAGVIHVDHHAIMWRPGTSDNFYVGTDGGVYETSDEGSSWFSKNGGLVTYQFYDICVSQPNPLRAWGGTQDNGTDLWLNSPSWGQGLGYDGMVCNGHPVDPLTVYGEIQLGSHYKSTNGGFNWFPIQSGIAGSGPWVTPFDVDPQNGDHLYTGTTLRIYRSSNGGASWTSVFSGSPPLWISISPVSSSLIWTIGSTNVRLSTNDGASWSLAGPFGFPTGYTTKVLAHPTDVNTAFVTFSGYETQAHIARTTDLGATWQDVTGDFPPQPVNAIAVDPVRPTDWYIGTDVGVWASVNEGETWVPFETGLPNVVVSDLEIQNSARKLRAGTYGRGLWEIDITADPVTAVIPTASSGSIDLMLDRPYPNPFGRETILRYAARKPGETATLAVYDVQGRLVETLARHPADGIIREIRWQPKRASLGVYFAMLQSGSDQKSQKLVIVE